MISMQIGCCHIFVIVEGHCDGMFAVFTANAAENHVFVHIDLHSK